MNKEELKNAVSKLCLFNIIDAAESIKLELKIDKHFSNSDEPCERKADGCNKQAKELKSDSDKVKIEIKSTHVPFMWHPPIIIDFNG